MQVIDFNTKKVRLKRVDDTQGLDRLAHFNTKKVRLKQVYQIPPRQRVLYFNTKKVRLKLSEQKLFEIFDDEFQYQKGAIKT